MAKKKKSKKECYDYKRKKMGFGLMLLLAGLVLYMGYGWDVVLMVVGALVFIKGLLMK